MMERARMLRAVIVRTKVSLASQATEAIEGSRHEMAKFENRGDPESIPVLPHGVAGNPAVHDAAGAPLLDRHIAIFVIAGPRLGDQPVAKNEGRGDLPRGSRR